jgi:hypothetical protein
MATGKTWGGRILRAWVVGFSAVVATLAGTPQAARAAIEPRSILKTYFETGDVPTQDQFSNLIDSYIHQTDDGLILDGIGGRHSGSGPNGQGLRIGGNVGINELLPDTSLGVWLDPALHPAMEPLWAGEFGFLPLRYHSTASPPQTHYGFLQISMASAGGGSPDSGGTVPPGPAIFVEHWVWESTPGATLTTFIVPEPAATAALLLLVALPVTRRTRRRQHERD